MSVALASCGSTSHPNGEPPSSSEQGQQGSSLQSSESGELVDATKVEELLTTPSLRVERVTLGKLESSEGSIESCGGDVLYADGGTVRVTLADPELYGAQDLSPGEALWIPAHVHWSVIASDRGATEPVSVLHAKVRVSRSKCPRANEWIKYSPPEEEAAWHENADGQLQVEVLLGGAQKERLPTSLGRLKALAGFSVPEHTHPESDENLWIKEGSGTMFVGDEVISITGDQWVHVPKGVKHSFKSDGEAPLVAIQMYVPSGPEQRFIRPATSEK